MIADFSNNQTVPNDSARNKDPRDDFPGVGFRTEYGLSVATII